MILIMSYSLLTLGQDTQTEIELKEASKVADKFFQGLTLLDLPEGKEMLSGLTFEQGAEYPVISANSTLYENLFKTDIDGVSGYKRLTMIKGTSKAGTSMELRYVLICYKDLTNNQWKIFEFRKSVDTQSEVSACISDIENPRDTDPRTLYVKLRNLAYWQIMDGKISSAFDNLNKALTEAEKSGDKTFVVKNLPILKQIIPNKN